MGYQFVHMQIHSRKGGKSGSTAYVLDEAQRIDGACPHVENPSPPETIWGMSIEELRALHDDTAEACQVTQSNGKTRKLRTTQNTLVSIVASHPDEMQNADPAVVREWEKQTVAWLQSEFGDALRSVIRHTDEDHPHIHAYCVSTDPELKAAALHPGYVAQTAKHEAGGETKACGRAYREAMRQFQDRYWQAVGLPCGLARIGPSRRRLTREQWHEEKKASQAVLTARRATAKLQKRGKEHVDQAKATAAEIAERAMSQADEAARLRAIAEKEREQARRTREEAEAALTKARTVGTRLAAFWSAARGWFGNERVKTAKAIEEAATAARAPLEAALSETREVLRKERHVTKSLKSSVQELSAELTETRKELQRVAPQRDPRRPGKGPR